MSQLRLIAVLLALGLTAGCRAQSDPQGASSASLDRRIEVTVRSQFSIPQDYNVTIGARKPSSITGYDDLPITIARGAKSQVVQFLISTDGKKLARLDSYDLTKEPGSDLDIAGRPIRGNPNAKVTVVSFDDLECPYCSRMHQSLFPSTLNRYKDQVRFIYKDFPLLEIHPWAMHAAVDANCLSALNPDAYWSFVDYLHAHGDEVSGTDRDPAKSFAALDRIARQQATLARLDSAKVDACLQKQDETEVNQSLKQASALGLEGAPALFVNGERINGAVPAEQLWMAIDRALRAAGQQTPAAAAQQPAPKPGAGN